MSYQQQHANDLLQHDLESALLHVVQGTATIDDAKLLAWGCGVSLPVNDDRQTKPLFGDV